MEPRRIVVIGSDYPDYELYCPHWQGIKVGLEKLGIPYLFASCRPTLDLEAIVAFQPDLVIYGLKDMIKRSDWREELKARLPSTVFVIWYGDYRDQTTTQISANCSEVDAMFVSNNAQEEYYKAKWKVPAVHFLPLGSEPIPSPHKSKLYDFPFVFIGSQITGAPFHERASVIEKFKVHDNLTIINSFEAPVRKRIYKEMPAIYSSARVCLDVSHFTNVAGYTSIRYWEIPAFWGFALTQRWPGCEEYYPPETRAYFDTYEEAIELRDYYLQHDREREAMVHAAHKLSYNYTYTQRFKTMFSLLR